MQDAVQNLWDREQIRACLLRYCRGADRNDATLLRSAFHDDCLIEHGKFAGGPDAFVAWAEPLHASALGTQHCILNQSIDLDGNTAHAETYFMFTRINPSGTPLTLAGGRYFDRLDTRDGAWRIAARVTLRDWANRDTIPDGADQSAMTSTAATLSAAERRFMQDAPAPSRDRYDPSYDRPLTNDPARSATFRALTGQS